MIEKRGLGRGLNALLGDEEIRLPGAPDTAAPTTGGQRKTVPVSALKPNPKQPRRVFDETALDELAQSIGEHGILQPILVRPHPEQSSMYEIVAGERRWRAAQKARLHDVPVIVHFLTDEDAAELALIENLQRADLSPLEEARGYKSLMDSYNHTQEELAETLGKSRSHIANMLRLLNLPTGVQDMLSGGQISTGHAKALLASPDPAILAQRIAEEGLSVREAEDAIAIQKRAAKARKAKAQGEKSVDIKALENRLSLSLGCRVAVRGQGVRGQLILNYTSLDQLDAIIARLEG